MDTGVILGSSLGKASGPRTGERKKHGCLNPGPQYVPHTPVRALVTYHFREQAARPGWVVKFTQPVGDAKIYILAFFFYMELGSDRPRRSEQVRECGETWGTWDGDGDGGMISDRKRGNHNKTTTVDQTPTPVPAVLCLRFLIPTTIIWVR